MGLLNFNLSAGATPEDADRGLLGVLPEDMVQPNANPQGFTPTQTPAPKLDSWWDRVRGPDAKGFTLGDKLFMAGSVAKGDTYGALSYRQNAQQQRQRNESQEASAALNNALLGAMENGKLNKAKLHQALTKLKTPFDIGDVAAAEKEFSPHMTAEQIGGDLYTGDAEDPSSWKQIIRGERKPIQVPGFGTLLPDSTESGVIGQPPAAAPPAGGEPAPDAQPSPEGLQFAFGGMPPPAPQAAPPAAPPAAGPAPGNTPDAVWARIKKREWGGQGPAPDSSQGATGSTQMLPKTAQAMANKLGVAYRPDLMRGNSPEALEYQDQLGRAYFDEGAQRYGGDLHKAAAYYHGGPDQGIWGPKTRAYADAVAPTRTAMDAIAAAAPQLQGGAAGDQLKGGGGSAPPGAPPAPAGYHWAVTPGEKWKDLTEEEAHAMGAFSGQRNLTDNSVKLFGEGKFGAGKGRPPTAGVLGKLDDHANGINVASSINSRLDNVIGQLATGTLKLGPLAGVEADLRNRVGKSDQQTANYISFKAQLEKLRNDSLRLNKGVQTEGDAIRAKLELIEHTTDPNVVLQRLREIQDLNNQTVDFNGRSITQIREDAGMEPIDPSQYLASALPNRGEGGGQGGGKGKGTPQQQQLAQAQAKAAPKAEGAGGKYQVGKVYQTPRGALRKTATGWADP